MKCMDQHRTDGPNGLVLHCPLYAEEREDMKVRIKSTVSVTGEEGPFFNTLVHILWEYIYPLGVLYFSPNICPLIKLTAR